MEIVFFSTSINQFLDDLDDSTRAKVSHDIDLLEKFGNLLGMPHSKPLRHPLFELRVTSKKQIRLLYVFHNRQAWILHVFVKKSQKTPKRELDKALANLDKLV